jgi:hypothetical protein
VELVPTVAVDGMSWIRMPESIVIVAVAVFFELAFEVAVTVIIRLLNFFGSGNILGAVNVVVEATVVLVFTVLERTPVSLVHGAAADGLGLGTAVVGLGVVVKVQSKFAETSVEPVIIAVNVTDCVTTSVPDPGLSVTTTWLEAVLLHALPHKLAAAAAISMLFEIFRHFIPTVSPTFLRSAIPSHLLRSQVLPNFDAPFTR